MFRRLFIIILALTVLGLSITSYAEQLQFSFPYITPEPTPYEITSSAKPESVKGSPSKKAEAKEDKDYLTIYAPEGFGFVLTAAFLNGDPLEVNFVGKGLSAPAVKIPYTKFEGLIVTASAIVAPTSSFESCLLSTSADSLTPSFPNDWFEFVDSQNDSGVIYLPFVTLCMRFGGVLYVHPCDKAGRPIDGVWPTPKPIPTSTPTPDPLETYRPSVDEEEGEAEDISGLTSVIEAVSSIISVVWRIFPYFTPIFIVLLIVLYLKVVL